MKAIEIKSLNDYETLAEQLNQVSEIVCEVVKGFNPSIDKVNLIIRPMFSNPLVHVVVEVQAISITKDIEDVEHTDICKIDWNGAGPTVEDALQDLLDKGKMQLQKVQDAEIEFGELKQRVENARVSVAREKMMFLTY